MSLSKLTTCLWFNGQACAAAEHYTTIFADSAITHTQRYTSAGSDIHKKPEGTVMAVTFNISGQAFVALNGGPEFPHTEAISFQVSCKDQGEVDYYWGKLSEGGDEKKQVCGWVADKFGVCWQVVPAQLLEWMRDSDSDKVKRVTQAMMGMKKMDIEGLKRAFDGA
ncbi:putative 3-demethylubiquinone-9 3-methyltransferase [Amniculicola lignicola CBS 123094]|uniref:Putative 3-demethylubiquinone-9 3-methyltransferase n=1 Tax=Amniculicola lignicola CBS 123094 TaxID=1392246 RepID=A0A6A5VX65_9PLEO|nr:putative 3-demethylubiquinone-9 3-methyltransferase [Amniculicola lignicola CBS 123094]